MLEDTQRIVDTIENPLMILYEDLEVALANRSFYRFFKVKPEEVEGRFIYDLGNRQWDIIKLRELLENILPKTTSIDNFEIKHDFPHIGHRKILFNACRIYMENTRTKLIVINLKDITSDFL